MTNASPTKNSNDVLKNSAYSAEGFIRATQVNEIFIIIVESTVEQRKAKCYCPFLLSNSHTASTLLPIHI